MMKIFRNETGHTIPQTSCVRLYLCLNKSRTSTGSFWPFLFDFMVLADYWLTDHPELRRTTQPSTADTWGRFIIKISSYHYRKSYSGDTTIWCTELIKQYVYILICVILRNCEFDILKLWKANAMDYCSEQNCKGRYSKSSNHVFAFTFK